MRPSRQQVIVAGSVLVDLLGYGMIVPLLPYLIDAPLETAALTIGWLSALYALLQALAAPLLGRLSDRIGRRPVLLICLGGSTLAYLLLALAQQPWQFAAALGLAGAAGSSLPTAQAYVTDSVAPAQRSAALGLLGAAFGLGIIGGALLGGLLSRLALELPAAVAAAIAAVNTVIAWRLLPESLPAARRALLQQPAPERGGLLRLPWPIPLLLPALFVVNVGFAGMQSIAALYTFSRFGWAPWQNGLLIAGAGLAAAFTQGWLLGRLQPRLGDRGLLLLGLALFGGALLPLGLVSQPWAAAPLTALAAAGMGLSVPPLTALLSGHAAPGQRGAVLGSLQLLVSLALIIGPPAAAAAFSRLGPSAPFVLAGAATLAALLVARPALVGPRPGAEGL